MAKTKHKSHRKKSMNKEEYEELLIELKRRISTYSIESVLTHAYINLNTGIPGESIFDRVESNSPYRDFMYIVGLFITSTSSESKEMTKADLIKVLSDVKRIYDHYQDPYINLNSSKLTDREKWEYIVLFSFFTNTTTTSHIKTNDDLFKLIDDLFSPFSNVLRTKYGLDPKEMISLFKLADKLISSMYQEFIDLGREYFKKKELTREEGDKLSRLQGKLLKISLEDISNEVNEVAVSKFLKEFSIKREEASFIYYTEKNPIDTTPLIEFKTNEYYLFHPRLLLNSIFDNLYSFMIRSDESSDFHKHKETYLEEETYRIVKDFFGASYTYKKLFEEPGNHEHDVIVVNQKTLVIIESKAARVREPFRDIERAIVRLKSDFNDSIQYAYNQCSKLEDKLINSEDGIPLFNKMKEIELTIHADEIEEIYYVIVTLNDFGPLNIKSDKYLNEIKNKKFLSIDVDTFRTMLESLKFLRYMRKDFLGYLDFKSKFNDRFMCKDELELFEFYLFNNIDNYSEEIIFLHPDNSTVFDDIYYYKKGYHNLISPRSRVMFMKMGLHLNE